MTVTHRFAVYLGNFDCNDKFLRYAERNIARILFACLQLNTSDDSSIYK